MSKITHKETYEETSDPSGYQSSDLGSAKDTNCKPVRRGLENVKKKKQNNDAFGGFEVAIMLLESFKGCEWYLSCDDICLQIISTK